MIQVFLHNSQVPRGQCGACRARSATWTITGQVLLLGQVKTDICDSCLKIFDIVAWQTQAQNRIMGEATKFVRDAME